METIVIGAGMAGLRAATVLQSAGHVVTVLDKGRRYGGRMATRRVDEAVFDTGALDLAAHGGAFRASLERWGDAGSAATVSRDSSAPRWRGAPMMRSLPTAIGESLAAVSVRLATTVTGLAVRDGRWHVSSSQAEQHEELTADALVLTAPAPQTLALLRTDEGLAADQTLSRLETVTYTPSLTVLTRPTDPTITSADLRENATDRESASDLQRLHDNALTGASPAVALTLQATAAFSAAHLDGDRTAAATVLAAQAEDLLAVTLEVVHVHGWRYAQVERGIDLPALRDDHSGAPLVLAGDLFEAHGDAPAGIRPEGVERAFVSGGAAAALLLAD
jgi:renalase